MGERRPTPSARGRYVARHFARGDFRQVIRSRTRPAARARRLARIRWQGMRVVLAIGAWIVALVGLVVW